MGRNALTPTAAACSAGVAVVVLSSLAVWQLQNTVPGQATAYQKIPDRMTAMNRLEAAAEQNHADPMITAVNKANALLPNMPGITAGLPNMPGTTAGLPNMPSTPAGGVGTTGGAAPSNDQVEQRSVHCSCNCPWHLTQSGASRCNTCCSQEHWVFRRLAGAHALGLSSASSIPASSLPSGKQGQQVGKWSDQGQVSKYSVRVAKGQCESATGMWGGDYSSSYWCQMEWAARGHYAVGDRVLDWGSGCGHKASWMRVHFGVTVFGIDMEAGAVGWAQKHSLGEFCATDGSKLSFLPDQSFNHVFSVAGIYHLPYETQCSALKHFLRVIIEGGTISLMWNGNHLKDRPSPKAEFWTKCVGESRWPHSQVSVVKEKTDIIGNWGLGPMDDDAFGRKLPNYAVRVVKLHSVSPSSPSWTSPSKLSALGSKAVDELAPGTCQVDSVGQHTVGLEAEKDIIIPPISPHGKCAYKKAREKVIASDCFEGLLSRQAPAESLTTDAEALRSRAGALRNSAPIVCPGSELGEAGFG